MRPICLFFLNRTALKDPLACWGCSPGADVGLWQRWRRGQRSAHLPAFRRRSATTLSTSGGQRDDRAPRGGCSCRHLPTPRPSCRCAPAQGWPRGEALSCCAGARRAGAAARSRGSSGAAKNLRAPRGSGWVKSRGTEVHSKPPRFALSNAKQRRKIHPRLPEKSGAQLGRLSARFKIQKPVLEGERQKSLPGETPIPAPLPAGPGQPCSQPPLTPLSHAQQRGLNIGCRLEREQFCYWSTWTIFLKI